MATRFILFKDLDGQPRHLVIPLLGENNSKLILLLFQTRLPDFARRWEGYIWPRKAFAYNIV